jgi:hypothetical protein
MSSRIEWLALACGVVILAVLLELVRRRKLREEYALLWIGASCAIIVVAPQRWLLHELAAAAGVHYPPMVLPLLAGFFGVLLAIHFSLVISRLAAENRILAQDLGLLRLEVAELARARERERSELPAPARVEGAPAPSGRASC